jgi:type I restriction enzyme M protein
MRTLVYVVGELQNYAITEADRDAIGDAYEVFIGKGLIGEEGQFFTPRNVVRMMIDILDPSSREFIIDPACGSGGFLIMALENVWKKMDGEGKTKNWSLVNTEIKKREVASKYFSGIDKVSFLAKVTKAYMALIGDGRGGVFCENSLKNTALWNHVVSDRISTDSFNVVITNPPFGSKIPVDEEDVLSQYDLAKVWKKDKASNKWEITSKLRKKQAPQILFIERCIQLLKPKGRLGIILPESLFGNPTYGYIIEYLKRHVKFLGLVSLPEELFQPYTHNKTCAVFLEKGEALAPAGYPIFMGIVKWCGQDSRGNKIPLDDVPLIAPNYDKIVRQKIISEKHDRLGFVKNSSEIKNNIMIPKYYDPELEAEIEALKPTHELVRVEKLLDDKVISLSTGKEIGKLSYGTGTIPFI